MKLLEPIQVSKLSLAFILHDTCDAVYSAFKHQSRGNRARIMTRTKRFRKPRVRRKAPPCSVAGCPNYTIDRGLCFRHGGGRTCSMEGCSTSAKHHGLCWKHGGSINCSVDGCTRGAKSKGLCWSHGGASKCTFEGCEKMTISKGLCWKHGGGKRCSFEGCKRPASEKALNVCVMHGITSNEVVVV